MANELKRSASILPAFLSSLGRLNINLQEFEARNQVLTRLLENGNPSTISFPYSDIIEELNSHKLAIVTLINKVADLRADFLLDKKNEDVLYDNYVAKKTAEQLELKPCKSVQLSGVDQTTDKNIFTFTNTDVKSADNILEFRTNSRGNIQTKDTALTDKETTSETETDDSKDNNKTLERSNICVKLDIQMPRRCMSENIDECKIYGKVYHTSDCDVNFAVKNGSMETLEKFLLFQDEEVSVLRKLTSCVMNLIARCQYLEEEKDTIMRALEQAKACSQTICGNLHQQITALRGKYEILQATLTLLLNKFEQDVTSRALSIPINDQNENQFKPSTLSDPVITSISQYNNMTKVNQEESSLSMESAEKEEVTDETDDVTDSVDDDQTSQISNDTQSCEVKEELDIHLEDDIEASLQTNINLEKEMVAIIDKELAKLLQN
ncbi:Hypothetical predicted protein [Octopus vulgaris]|uniref:Uncharacterized protein n=1 Tax=Octopus vulgaris TaxID=6645 RepID=A0AA36AV35_OCTVU|nr:Hypothetical predicted protein [Octopus vulgaris]